MSRFKCVTLYIEGNILVKFSEYLIQVFAFWQSELEWWSVEWNMVELGFSARKVGWHVPTSSLPSLSPSCLVRFCAFANQTDTKMTAEFFLEALNAKILRTVINLFSIYSKAQQLKHV